MFMKVRFPTIYVLNKVDTPNADANVLRICEKYGEVCNSNSRVILQLLLWSYLIVGSHNPGKRSSRVFFEETAQDKHDYL